MDEMNKHLEELNNEPLNKQDNLTPEYAEVNTPFAQIPTPKPPTPKLPLIIGGAVAAVVVIAIVLAIILGGGKQHKHNYGAWNVVDEPTCLAAGIEERVCECGENEMRRIDALGHTEVIDSAVNPTCLNTGLTEGKHCSTCGTVILAQETVAQLSHTYSSDLDIDCNNCGAIREDNCNHAKTEPIPGKAATCLATGLTEGTRCSACKTTLVAQQQTSKIGHTYDDKNDDKCNVCGYKRDIQSNPSATEIANQAVKYVGEIIVYDKSGAALGQATGFVMSSDGKIITNYHVIEGAYSAEITINSKKYSIASVLAYDANIDLAVLKINATGLTAATISKNSVSVGETVYAIGSSRGLTNTFSQGIVTYANRIVDGVSHVQHDASITHGNSGGPLLNVFGEVIGINTWGVADSQNLNFAVAVDELDNLIYKTPLSLADFYDSTNKPYDVLVDWLLDNYNASYENQIRFDDYDDSIWYSLCYESDPNSLYIDVLWEFDDGAEMYIFIDLSDDQSKYYYAYYVNDGYRNDTSGYINASTFTENTSLSYTSYDGTHWNKETLLNLYQLGIVNLLEWFDWATHYYDMGVTIKDMGFDVFEVTDNELSPLDVLMNFLTDVGDYDYSTQWYEVRKTYDSSDYSVRYSLVYNTNNDSVFMSMSFYPDWENAFYCYLSLKPGSYGAYYGASYSVYENGGFTDLNDTWGYINPSTFTDTSSLSYKEYNGLPQDKAYLLNIYSSCIHDMLDWLDSYLNTNRLGITIADLGYTSY